MSTDTIIALIGLVVTLVGGLIAVVKILAKIDPLVKQVEHHTAEIDALKLGQQGVVTTTQQTSATTVAKAHARIDELVQTDLTAIRATIGAVAQQLDGVKVAADYQARELERSVNSVQQLLLADRERSVEHHALVDKVDRDIVEGRERQRALADLDARLRVQEARRN